MSDDSLPGESTKAVPYRHSSNPKASVEGESCHPSFPSLTTGADGDEELRSLFQGLVDKSIADIKAEV